MSLIHPTAIVDKNAKIGQNVTIGPYCTIGPNVQLFDDVQLMSHVVVEGHTSIGSGTKVFPFAALGLPPQHLGHKGEPTRLEIGSNNMIRESVTMHPGTVIGGGLTRVGNNCLIMVGCHVAHDCRVGNNIIMANNVILAGHVEIGDFAYLGGMCAVHQFVRVGKHAMLGGMSGLSEDIIPYGFAFGHNRAALSGLNVVGLKRRGFNRQQIHTLRTAYRLLFAEEGTMSERLADVASLYDKEEAVMEIVAFINKDAERAICQPHPD
ncbi:MAG: acyl-ACP--UDP-N-acetylglucosamine O-acyltransferase [Alphaproteobacteria bacterium]